jgi:hypothetical protein
MSAPAAAPILTLPKKSGLIVIESRPDRLEVRTRTGFSFIYFIGMMFLLGAFVVTEVVMPQELNWGGRWLCCHSLGGLHRVPFVSVHSSVAACGRR